METRLKSFTQFIDNSIVISEHLKYHVDHGLSITESVFRPGSAAHIQLLVEARSLHQTGKIELSDTDSILFETTDLGKTGIYQGKSVPLDMPIEIIVETNQPTFSIHEVTPDFQIDVMGKLVKNIKPESWVKNRDASCITFYGEVDGKPCKCKYDDGHDAYIFEAKYQGREVTLGKPMRSSGGKKKYVVYVKNPSTGRVKKISFGDVHGGLTAKVSNPKARKSFAARHNCAEKKDKTKAGYWACRINRYAHLWGGKTYPGYW